MDMFFRMLVVVTLFLWPRASLAADDVTPGELRAYATIHSIGVEWDVAGDDDHDAAAAVSYRVQGAGGWRDALGLFRVDYNGLNMLAGSVLFLEPGTTYEVRLDLSDPDGGAEARTATVSTRPIPVAPAGGRTLHVAPGSGGGDGSAGNPFGGIGAAQAVAQPGDTFLVHAGTYAEGRIGFDRAGQPGNYIVWKSADDGEANLSGGIDVAADHVWLEGLTVRDGPSSALTTSNAPDDVVVIRCGFYNNHYAFDINSGGTNWYIADNDIVGDTPPSSGSFDGEGVELKHTDGHVVAYNHITYVADGISYPGTNCDLYGNDIFDTSDDGIEPDYGYANNRVWGNRLHNTGHNGFSFQPQNGAPWYFIRNQVVSMSEDPIKFRDVYNRFLFAHNTVVNWGDLFNVRADGLANAYSRNNLWVSVTGGRIWTLGEAFNWMTDLDYDGFDWGDSAGPFRYLGSSYSDVTAFTAATGQEAHGVRIRREDCFQTFDVPGPPGTGVPPQLMTLKDGCNAIDAGEPLPGINDDFQGGAPDLGAYEYGGSLPHYGPRVQDDEAPTIPTDLAANAVSDSEIDLTWTASSDDVGVTGYRIHRDGQAVATSGSTRFRDGGLSASTAYTYRVSAFDAAGNESGLSDAASATTLEASRRPRLSVKRADPPVSIDGDLSEFAEAVPLEIQAGAARATFRMLWDAGALYCAVQVVDADLWVRGTGRDGELWDADGIEIMMDPLLSRGAVPDDDDRHVIVTVAGDLLDAQGAGSSEDRSLTMNVVHAAVPNGTLGDQAADVGYTVELSIPWSSLGVTPSAGMILGADLALNDAVENGLSSADWAGLDDYALPDDWNELELLDVAAQDGGTEEEAQPGEDGGDGPSQADDGGSGPVSGGPDCGCSSAGGLDHLIMLLWLAPVLAVRRRRGQKEPCR